MGPYDLNVLKQGVASGQFNQATPVWREEMSTWTPAGQVNELQALFGGGNPPPPPFTPPTP